MEGKTLQDFLQVSVNMQKFNLFTTSISSILSLHEKQLQNHTKELIQVRMTMEEKVTRLQGQLDYQKDKFDKKRREDNAFFNGFITDITKKYDKYNDEVEMRLGLLEDKVGQDHTQNQMMQIIKEEIQIDLNKQTKLLEEQISLIEVQVKQLQADMKKSVTSQDFLLKNVIQAYDSKKKTPTELVQPKFQKKQMLPSSSKNHHKNHHRQQQVYHQKKQSFSSPQKVLNLEQATLKEAQQRRRKKAQQKCENENLQYATISAKVDALENRLTAKQNQSLNKVVYASKNGHLQTQPSQQHFSISMDRIELQRKDLQQNITGKLQNIEQIINQRFQTCDKQADRLKTKVEGLTSQLQKTIKRVEKQKYKAPDYSWQIKKMEEKRSDEKVVDGLVLMVKRQAQHFQEELEARLEKKIWDKEFPKISDKLQILGQTLQEKADREEIKRAFQFIEDKIKQIVMIMASEVQNEKQGAGRRLPFKCLSCDKDLQNSVQSTQRNLQVYMKGQSRCNTSNLRKRLRGNGIESR